MGNAHREASNKHDETEEARSAFRYEARFLAKKLAGSADTMQREAAKGPSNYPSSKTVVLEDGTLLFTGVTPSELNSGVPRRMPSSWLQLAGCLDTISELGLRESHPALAKRLDKALDGARGLVIADEATICRDVEGHAKVLRVLASQVERFVVSGDCTPTYGKAGLDAASPTSVQLSSTAEALHQPRVGSRGWSRPISKAEAGKLLGGNGSKDNLRKHLASLLVDAGEVMRGKYRGKQQFCLAWVETIEPKAVAHFQPKYGEE